jgi:hypothetical protein
LAEQFPSHVVCDWLGNSEDIARKHYFQTTDDHFAQAIGGPSSTGGAKSGALSAQNAAQQAHAGGCSDSHALREIPDAAMVYATSGDPLRENAESLCGWGGIRTPGGLAPTAVFKTAALDHSATHPLPVTPSLI